jgi:hypothetical protein
MGLLLVWIGFALGELGMLGVGLGVPGVSLGLVCVCFA